MHAHRLPVNRRSRARTAGKIARIAGIAGLLFLVPARFAAQPPPTRDGEVPLTLSEVLATALRENLDLVIAHANPRIAEQNVESQRSPFDPVIGAQASFNESKVDRTIKETGAASESTDFTTDVPAASATWTHLLDFGGQYSIELRGNSVDISPQLRFDPQSGFATQFEQSQDSAVLDLGFTMPLLRGFGKEVNTEQILVAQGNLDISRNDLQLLAMNTIKQVEDAYWDLLAARAALDVERQSLELARDLLDLNRKKVEVGTLAPIEITQAEAGVASREESVIVLETSVENLEDNLLRLMAAPEDDPRWERTIVPTDRPEYHDPQVDLDRAIATALERRPEILSARKQLENSELSQRSARNGTKHRLDLQVGLTNSRTTSDSQSEVLGLPGTAVKVNQSQDGGPDWRVALVYGYPLHNRAAEANFAIARLNRESAEVSLENTTQLVRVDVRTAVRNVVSGAKRVKAAESNTALQLEKLEAEQKKFENGMSTSFEVLTFQTDLSNARLADINARLDYVKALNDLERAQGVLLEARGLKLSEELAD